MNLHGDGHCSTVNTGNPADTPQFVRPIMMHDFDEKTLENEIIRKWLSSIISLSKH